MATCIKHPKTYLCGNCSTTFPSMKGLASHGGLCFSLANNSEALTLFPSGNTVKLAKAQLLHTVTVEGVNQWSSLESDHSPSNFYTEDSQDVYSNFPSEYLDESFHNQAACSTMFDSADPIALIQPEKNSTSQKNISKRKDDNCYRETRKLKLKMYPLQSATPGQPMPKRFKVICPTCEKVVWRTNFYEHMNIHTGRMPHKCSICSKLFRHYTTFKDHMNMHDGKVKYKCPHCQWTGMSNLRRHIRNQHQKHRPVAERQPVDSSAFKAKHDKKLATYNTSSPNIIYKSSRINTLNKRQKKISDFCGSDVFLTKCDKHPITYQESIDRSPSNDILSIKSTGHKKIDKSIESLLDNVSRLAEDKFVKINKEINSDSLHQHKVNSEVICGTYNDGDYNNDEIRLEGDSLSKHDGDQNESVEHDHGYYALFGWIISEKIQQNELNTSEANQFRNQFADSKLPSQFSHTTSSIIKNRLKYKCLTCDEGFYTSFQLVQHDRVEHGKV